MDSIGGMLNHIGTMPKTHYKRDFCNVLLEKDNGIVMETVGFYVMVSIVFFSMVNVVYVSVSHTQ